MFDRSSSTFLLLEGGLCCWLKSVLDCSSRVRSLNGPSSVFDWSNAVFIGSKLGFGFDRMMFLLVKLGLRFLSNSVFD